MARGKLKYKDVVGGRQGKRKKSQNTKPRKKYNLQRNDKKLRNPKRKYNDNKYKNHNLEELQTKKPKLEEPVETESSSESEVEDDLKKLLNTFDGNLNNKKSLAIDSSDSDSETEKEDKNISEDSSDSSSESETVENKSISEDESTLNNLVGNIREEGSLPDESESKDSETEGNHKTDLNEPISMGTSEHESLTEEETEELEIDAEDSQNDENDMENLQDPFVKHVFYELHDSVLESFANNPISVNMYSEYWPKLGKLNIQIPKCSKAEVNADSEFTIAEKKIYAPPGKLPKRIDVKSAKFKDLHVKSQIIANLNKANKSIVNGLKDILTPLQTELLSILNNYQDLYYPERTYNNAEEVRFAYCLHAANHILKTRLKVIHHNARLSKKDEVPDEFRDQGLVRPKVLIIVPFKDAAYKTIQMLIDIILPEVKGNVMNKKRFIDDYTGNELILPKKNPKPEDYEQTFQGNTSDDFKMGITVTKKSLKLYADFYSSDVIVASPLGLRTIIGAEGEQERDYDFLASIELLILDQMEIFLMQNWDHIFHILNHMHLQPKESHGTDFSRVRTWSLNGWAKYYRQTLIFSSLILPEINAVFNKKCQNYAGKVRVSNQVEFGSISQVFVQLPHVFHRFDAQNTAEVLDARFEFFMSKILSQQKDSMMKQTVIFIPNYFDYVRIRNYFKREDLSFVQICEYSKEGKVARARDMFYHGDSHFLLYTERFHFFNRKRIKGIRHLVFYQPPNFPHFYYEMCNLMQEANMNKKVGNMSNMTVTVIYSKYDVHQLSAIVGTERAAKMIQSERKVHMMVTGVD